MDQVNLPSRATFVVSHLSPTLGLERVAIDVISGLSHKMPLEVVVIGGTSDDSAALPRTPTRILGKPLRGAQRLRSVSRLFKARAAWRGSQVVFVGAWAAIPGLLVAPKACTTIVWEHSFLRENVQSSRNLRLLWGAARVLYRRANQIVVVSEALRDDLSRAQLDSVVVANPMTLQTTRNKVEPRPAKPHQLCAVGSLSKIKNQSLILKAMSLLPKSYTLVIVGDGPMRSKLSQMVFDLDLGSRVTFTGHVSRDQALDIIGDSGALVHASVGETFGLVYGEAALMGTPVVTVANRLSSEWARKGVRLREVAPTAASMAAGISAMHKGAPTSAVSPALLLDDHSPATIVTQWTSLLRSASMSSESEE